ncbi:MAG: DUF417 family protein [Candidatus Sulfotelmatobacter sp.]
MPTNSAALSKTIAAVRIATSVFFLLFGEYKLAGPGFAHGGFQTYLQSYIAGDAVGFYRPLLEVVVQPHAAFFAYAVGVIESLIALSLLLGLWVRPMSVVGALYMLHMTLCTWWSVGHGVPVWRYFGSELDHLPLLLLFLIFHAADAGRTWGWDARRKA